MVIFFPEPYEDELLYSVLARYHIRSANLSAKHTLRELFGSSSVTASMELPANIDTLIKNMHKNSSISAEELIYKHTLYPFYTAFMEEERAQDVYNLMLGNNGSKIFSNIGASNKPIKSNQYLRFCPDCAKEDIEMYGETYWHRMHQIPSLFVCLKHKKLLLNSTVEVHLKNRQEYKNASMELCNIQHENNNYEMFNSAIDRKFNDEIINKSIILGENIKFLMDNKVAFKDMNYFRNIYVSRLIEKGYAARKSLIYQEELLRAFKNFYGEAFLNLAQSNFEIGKANWVTNISRKHRNGFHPIQHLLFMQFLDITAKEVFSNSIEIKRVKKKNYYIKSEDKCLPYRIKWLELIKNNLGKSKSYIRDNNIAIYTWLYRHDKKWLDENSPKKKVGVRKETLINWEKRDEECLNLVMQQVKCIKEYEEKPERITIGLVGRRIKKSMILQKHLDRMPNTKKYLIKNIETLEDFQIRRIKWAVNKLAEAGNVSKWEVVRLAGLGKEDAIKLKKTILYCIKEV